MFSPKNTFSPKNMFSPKNHSDLKFAQDSKMVQYGLEFSKMVQNCSKYTKKLIVRQKSSPQRSTMF